MNLSEVKTLEQAKKLNLEVYLLPLSHRTLIENLFNTFNAIGREAIEFETQIAGYTLTVVAVEPRVGIIAPEMKRRKKSVREFIQSE